MCELFALSSQNPTRVTFSLEEFMRHGGGTQPHADGWGLAFYYGTDAQVFREPSPAVSSEWLHFLLHHPHASRCVMSHVRRAGSAEVALRNTQPFSRIVHGRRHLFCHNGNLSRFQASVPLRDSLPVGESDSEYAFCWLIDETRALWNEGTPSLQQRVAMIGPALATLAKYGSTNVLYCDSEYLYAFGNHRQQPDGLTAPAPLYYLERHCECDADSLQESGLHIENGDQYIVLIASVPLSDEPWQALTPGQLVVARQGRIVSK
jgi:glutamine amidotransferase